MEINFTRKMIMDLTLDSSETLMFTKGGRHTVKIAPLDLTDYDQVEINVQMMRNAQGRFDFVTGRKSEENDET